MRLEKRNVLSRWAEMLGLIKQRGKILMDSHLMSLASAGPLEMNLGLGLTITKPSLQFT